MTPEFVQISSIDDISKELGKTDAIAFLISDELCLSKSAREADKAVGGLITLAIEGEKFEGKEGQVAAVVAPKNLGAARILIAGLGKKDKINHLSYEKAAGKLVEKANAEGLSKVVLVIDEAPGKSCDDKAMVPARAAVRSAFGAKLRAYSFDKYFTKKEKSEKPTLKEFAIALCSEKEVEEAKSIYADFDAVAEGTIFTRNIITEPSNVINPETLSQICKSLEEYGLEVELLGEKEMEQLGMGALLSVGQGSTKESHLVIMKWNGAEKAEEQPVAFVGKGVTFDTGGISLKPSSGMEEMKYDMGGAGVVIGLMKTLALRKAKVNAVGVVGLVENMPDGGATRPGDVVTSMSGQTIEVINTDAEGRVVLADALWYTQDRFKPKFMINLATLTGAIVVALGSSRAGLFSNNDELAERIYKVGEKTGQEVWRLPLGEVYDKQINSDIADMQNIGKEREAGSITAAQFLQRFVNDVPWAHIDIAGVTWDKKGSATAAKGATGYGVKLLNALISKYYENK